MKAQIEKALAEVAAKFNDRRLHVCKLTADVDEQGAVKVGGRVLEASYLDAVRAALPAGVQYDVMVLRQNAKTMSVATNLTDLHLEASFLSELLTQVTNGTPLEILEEKEKWALVRQYDGYIGWAYRGYLMDAVAEAATHVVVAPTLHVFRERAASGQPLSRLVAGTRLAAEVEGPWARVRPLGPMLPEGFVDAAQLRPLSMLPLSAGDARRQMIDDARRFAGVYYLWGGGSAWGIDCSGLAQLVHRLGGYTIPRDADLQFAAGRPVEPPFDAGDLIFFGESEGRRKITHVGLSTGGWRMIHSSRSRNGVYEEDVQGNENLRKSYVGGRTFL